MARTKPELLEDVCSVVLCAHLFDAEFFVPLPASQSQTGSRFLAACCAESVFARLPLPSHFTGGVADVVGRDAGYVERLPRTQPWGVARRGQTCGGMACGLRQGDGRARNRCRLCRWRSTGGGRGWRVAGAVNERARTACRRDGADRKGKGE